MVVKDNKIRICQTNRKIFRYSLLWPREGSDYNPGLNYKFRVLSFFATTAILTVPATVHLVLTMLEHPEVKVTEDIAEVIAIYGNVYMVYAFVKNQRNIAVLLGDLSNFKKFGLPPGFEKQNKILNLRLKVLFTYALFTVIFYGFMKLSGRSDCRRENEARGLKDNDCGLIAPLWIPFNTNNFLVYYLCFLYIVAIAHLLLKMCLHISYFAFEIGQHIILRINHLKIMLEKCFDDQDYETTRKKLTKCISYHIAILESASKLDNAFFECMFGHLLLTGAICACVEKQIVDKINPVAGVLHIFGWISALFLGCMGGQNLLNASEIIPAALWDSKWYEADLRLRKDVLLMLLRSQKDFYIRAGPFGILSYALFVSVLKMSYSILCMLTS